MRQMDDTAQNSSIIDDNGMGGNNEFDQDMDGFGNAPNQAF